MIRENLRQAWRWWSMRVSALGAALLLLAIAEPDAVTAIWGLLPPAILDLMPRNVALIVPLAIQIAAMVARVVPQAVPVGEPDERAVFIARVTPAEVARHDA